MTDPVRRAVTAHDEEGMAVLLSNQEVALAAFRGADNKGAVVWTMGSCRSTTPSCCRANSNWSS